MTDPWNRFVLMRIISIMIWRKYIVVAKRQKRYFMVTVDPFDEKSVISIQVNEQGETFSVTKLLF